MTKKDNNNNCRRDFGETPLIRQPTGHGNLSVLTGVKSYHSPVLHTRALLLHQLTQSDQTEEKTNKLTNKRPPRTDWRPREQLHNYSQFDPFLIIKTYIYIYIYIAQFHSIQSVVKTYLQQHVEACETSARLLRNIIEWCSPSWI